MELVLSFSKRMIVHSYQFSSLSEMVHFYIFWFVGCQEIYWCQLIKKFDFNWKTLLHKVVLHFHSFYTSYSIFIWLLSDFINVNICLNWMDLIRPISNPAMLLSVLFGYPSGLQILYWLVVDVVQFTRYFFPIKFILLCFLHLFNCLSKEEGSPSGKADFQLNYNTTFMKIAPLITGSWK